MANANASIQQHEPLRVPAGWGKQERAMVMQLDEILDDIYRRFGRLRLQDMGKAFRQSFADLEGNYTELIADVGLIETRVGDAEGNITTLQQTAEELVISVAGKYDKVSGIDIVAAGIEISGSTYIKIKSGGKFLVDSGNFSIDENGNVRINGSGTFSGALSAATGTFAGSLSAATGTFAGTLSAACITSGTMSADRISGGTIDATNVTITNLNASNITSGTMSASRITSGTMSADRISGGTLTLGGSNNANGSLIIKNAAGNTIGTWDKDGLSVTAGSFYETVTGKYDKISGIDITSAGVSITGNKHIRLSSGSEGIIYNNGELIIGENSLLSYGAKIRTWGYNGVDSDSVKLELSVYNGQYGLVLGMVPIWEPGLNDYLNTMSIYPLNNAGDSYVGHPNGSFTHGYINNVYANRLEPRAIPSRNTGIGFEAPFYFIAGTNIHYTYLVQDSSRKKKHNIRDLESLGGIIDRLKPVRYVYNSDKTERDRFGLIYEDTVGLLPEICIGADGNEGINYVELVPALLREIKDLRVRVARLEAA